jgi:hypothetical protein
MPKVTIRELFASALYEDFDTFELRGDGFVFLTGYN